TRAARAAIGDERVPRWTKATPHPAPAELPFTRRGGATAVYLPACINRIFGPSRHATAPRPLPEALVAVSARAGKPVWIPEDVAGTCCATPFTSKGFKDAQTVMAKRLEANLWRWSEQGSLPVVIDATSCALGVKEEAAVALGDEARERLARVEVIDPVAWANDHLLPGLEITLPVRNAALHPTCASRHLGLAAKAEALVGALAGEVHVPSVSTCCGFAGDRGFLHPELTAAAVRPMADDLGVEPFDAHVSANRTCEIGMEQATGRPYESVIQLLERATR
ncbi:MAG: (Fe-S)-binding protein, partial [Thermoleophilaceae bacterium]|nr:(Fe-S)-binding protein [Thermoleophilaceae bacterium]